MTVLLLELNEINFDHVRAYTTDGKLPVLARLIDHHGVTETTSETSYEALEPWIQWVTAHTGKSFAEHGVFRLGDIVKHDIPQIWETLESQGLSVGAISPMNAKNRCRNAAFFVPDPWTPTQVTGSGLLRQLYESVAQAVNDNAQSRLTPRSAAWLLAGLAAYARPANYGRYLSAMRDTIRHRPWAKALMLDCLLADIFLGQVKRKKPDFASLFLNAGAHIQHHYMYNSRAYPGPNVNPEWYVAKGLDPVLEVYELYDRIVGQAERILPGARLIIATGLHQDPYPQPSFYWRLKDHADFLTRVGIGFDHVEPRMSRDFMVYFQDADQAATASRRLANIRSVDGTALFEVDNRGADLFVMLTWPHDIGDDFEYRVDNAPVRGLRDDVAFVAIKNGEHNGIGYLLDTGAGGVMRDARVPLQEIPAMIAAACGARWMPV